MIEVLLSNGASPDGRDSGLRLPQFGTIPLYTAIIYDRFEEFIQWSDSILIQYQLHIVDFLLAGLELSGVKHAS